MIEMMRPGAMDVMNDAARMIKDVCNNLKVLVSFFDIDLVD